MLYHHSNSIFHYMHGFTKIIIFGIIFTFFPFLLDRLVSLGFLLLVLLALLLYIRPTRRQWLLFIPVIFLAVLMGSTYFFTDMGGERYFQVAFGWLMVQVTATNLHFALLFVLRILTWSCAFFLIMFTTRPQDLITGLKMMRVPEFMTLALSLAFRYWSLMIADAKMVVDAQFSRGTDFRSGHPLVRIRRFSGVVIPVIFVLLKRFRTMSFALTLKGVGQKGRRTRYYDPSLSVLDRWAMGVSFALLAGAVGLDWYFQW